MKHGTEANILHSRLLWSIPLCTLLLIVNLRRSYDAKVQLTHPRCRVIEFACASPPPHTPGTLHPIEDMVTCNVKCAGLRGGACSCQSNESWPEELAWCNLSQSTYHSWALSLSLFLFIFCSLFSFSFFNQFFIHQSAQLIDALLQQSSASHSQTHTHAEDTHLLLFTEQLLWASWGTEGGVQ